MKTLGGNAKPIQDGLVTAEECLRYALSLPVTTVVSGIDTMEWLQKNAKVAASFQAFDARGNGRTGAAVFVEEAVRVLPPWAYHDGGTPGTLWA